MTMRCGRLLSTLLAGLLLAPVGATAQEQKSEPYRWDSVAIGGGGFVSGITASHSERNLVYARTDVGGAYRWDAPNSRWIPLLDWNSEDEKGYQGVESIALDPRDPARLYLLAGTSYYGGGRTAILRSADRGRSFEAIDVTPLFKAHGNGIGRQSGEKLQVDPGSSNVLYAGTRAAGLFRSADRGSSWTRLSALNVTETANGNGISFVWLDPTSISGGLAQRIVVGISRYGNIGPNLYLSRDAGRSFTAVAGSPSALMPQRAAATGDGHLYITYANGAGPGWVSSSEPVDKGQILKLRLSDGAMSDVTPAGYPHPFGGISADPRTPGRLVASTINVYQGDQGPRSDAPGQRIWGDLFFVTTDGGASWSSVNGRGFVKDVKEVAWLRDMNVHWVGSVEFDPFDPSRVWAVSGNGVFRTDNIDASPSTWTAAVGGLEETVPLNMVSIPGGPLVSVIGDYDGFVHTDATKYGRMHAPAMGTTTGLAVASLRPTVWVRSGGNAERPALYVTQDGGTSWTAAAAVRGPKGQVALSADGKVLLHHPDGSTTTWRSTDLGRTWTAVRGLAAQGVRPVADMVNPSKFYAYVDGAMLVSTDGGASFTTKAMLDRGGSAVIRTAPGREGHVWIALNGNGLARSTDSGASFGKLAGVTQASAVGFGKAATASGYPAIYIWGTPSGGVLGVHRSIDGGASWVRVNDDAHEFGGPGNGATVIGDMNTYGVVYMSTAGRGIAYGRPDSNAAGAKSIVSRRSGKCLDVRGVGMSSGTPVIQWTCTGARNQLWTAESAGGGYVRLKAAHSGMCLDLERQSTDNIVPLVQAPCGSAASQQWLEEDLADGVYRLRSRLSGMCADVDTGSTANGATLIQFSCGTQTNQQWSDR